MIRRGRYQRGQSLVEFALLLPVLLLIVLGAIDFGRLYYSYVSITNGARNGAHYASSSAQATSDLEGIRDAVLGDTSGLPDTSPSNPDVGVATGTDGQGRLYADVTVSYTFSVLVPWPGIPETIDMERTVRARVAE